MDCLWSRDGETTVREVLEQLQQQREIAYTTVMSTMERVAPGRHPDPSRPPAGSPPTRPR